MKFTSRSYSGKLFRPKPEIFSDDENQRLIIVTPWGERNLARKSIEDINNFLSEVQMDDELTIPSGTVANLKLNESKLFNALSLVHKQISQLENADEYTNALEVTAIEIQNSKISWAQAGHPNLYLARPGCSLIPLSHQTDLSLETCKNGALSPPMPNNLLGLGSISQIYSQSFSLQPSDKIILTSKSYIPKEFYQLSFSKCDLDHISHIFSQQDTESPFWLGLIEL